jgi:hypothetical protein
MSIPPVILALRAGIESGPAAAARGPVRSARLMIAPRMGEWANMSAAILEHD